MNSSPTTAAVEISALTGRLISAAGSCASRASSVPMKPRAPLGSAIRSYEPLRLKWEPEGYLESSTFLGLPHVPEAAVAVALSEIADAISHAQLGLAPAPRQEALSLIGSLRLSKNAARMPGADGEGRVRAMLEEIADIPADILREAVREIRLSGHERDDWFPTGGRIRAAAAPEMTRRRLRLQRLLQWQIELEQRARAQAENTGALTNAEREELEAIRRRLGIRDLEREAA